MKRQQRCIVSGFLLTLGMTLAARSQDGPLLPGLETVNEVVVDSRADVIVPAAGDVRPLDEAGWPQVDPLGSKSHVLDLPAPPAHGAPSDAAAPRSLWQKSTDALRELGRGEPKSREPVSPPEVDDTRKPNDSLRNWQMRRRPGTPHPQAQPQPRPQAAPAVRTPVGVDARNAPAPPTRGVTPAAPPAVARQAQPNPPSTRPPSSTPQRTPSSTPQRTPSSTPQQARSATPQQTRPQTQQPAYSQQPARRPAQANPPDDRPRSPWEQPTTQRGRASAPPNNAPQPGNLRPIPRATGTTNPAYRGR